MNLLHDQKMGEERNIAPSESRFGANQRALSISRTGSDRTLNHQGAGADSDRV